MVCSGWSSLHCLIPARRTRSREELGAADSEATPLPIPRGGQPRPFLPHCESTGGSCLHPQTTELWEQGSRQSGLPVSRPAPCNGKMKKTTRWSLHAISRHLLIVSSSHSLSDSVIQCEEDPAGPEFVRHVNQSHNSQRSEGGATSQWCQSHDRM